RYTALSNDAATVAREFESFRDNSFIGIADAHPDSAVRGRSLAGGIATVRSILQHVRFHPGAGRWKRQRGESGWSDARQDRAGIFHQRRTHSRRPQLERERDCDLRRWQYDLRVWPSQPDGRAHRPTDV